MPFKSQAQVRQFEAMVQEGKMTKDTLAQWIRETPDMKKLPERATEKKTKKGR